MCNLVDWPRGGRLLSLHPPDDKRLHSSRPLSSLLCTSLCSIIIIISSNPFYTQQLTFLFFPYGLAQGPPLYHLFPRPTTGSSRSRVVSSHYFCWKYCSLHRHSLVETPKQNFTPVVSVNLNIHYDIVLKFNVPDISCIEALLSQLESLRSLMVIEKERTACTGWICYLCVN